VVENLFFSPPSKPSLNKYGVTLAQATSAEDAALAEIAASRKTGRLEPFTGPL
jgi:hypothetical protein